ncbi:Transposon Tf2-11 polyprotein, partial [Dictyocoela muelleri]
KETLAIIKSLIHFKPLIYNTKVYIYSDNKNLTFNGPLTKRMERWKLTLEEYNYELIHIEGREIKGADSLSRLFKITSTVEGCDKLRLEFPYTEISQLRMQLEQRNLDLNAKKSILNKLKAEIKSIHQNLLHPGINKMPLIAQKYIMIPKIRHIIQQVCEECHHCNSSKDYRRLYGITINQLVVSKTNEGFPKTSKDPSN